MHTCGRMCKDIGVKTTFPRTMGISFRLHPERSRALHPNQSRALHPERSRGVAPRAEPRGWCICIGFLVSASLDEQFERSRVHPERSRVHPERSRVHPERSRGVEVYALDFSSRLRSTNSLSEAEGCTPSEAEGWRYMHWISRLGFARRTV